MNDQTDKPVQADPPRRGDGFRSIGEVLRTVLKKLERDLGKPAKGGDANG